MDKYIYMYGQVMSTYSFLLSTDFPKADGYGEIHKKYHLLGGETGTACAVLCSYNAPVKLGGTHMGNLNKHLICDYFKDKTADISELVYEDFDGITDYVIIDKNTRTCFGEWGKHSSREIPYYEKPCEESVLNADCVGADPYFGQEIAELCVKHGKKYVTIDCDHDSFFHKNCEINCVSHQYLDWKYADMSYEDALKLYSENTNGLTIFTLGENGAMYGRKGEKPHYVKACKVEAVSTLGAGDCFKAGAIYGLYKKMDDKSLVEFACATSGCAVTKYPIALNPPTLDEVTKLIKENYGE